MKEAAEPPTDPVLQALIERVLIQGHVLRRYHRITPQVRWRDTPEAIRRELRRGHLTRERWEGGSYITVVVPRRFRLDVEHEVNSDGLVAVDLRPLRRRRKRRTRPDARTTVVPVRQKHRKRTGRRHGQSGS